VPLHFSGLWNKFEIALWQVKWCNYWIQNIADTWDVAIRDGVRVWQDVGEMVKVKFTLEQATKAQRGSRAVALLFL
jgi:hypothetical protein